MADTNSSARKSAQRAQLFVLSGPDVGRSFEIFHGASIGRAPDRAVILRDRSISRHHAHFEFLDGVWSIVDDGSTNGFEVDGVKAQRAELTDLREFAIGEVSVRLRTQVAADAAPAVQPIVRAAAAPSADADEIVLEDEILLEGQAEATFVSVQPRQVAPAPNARASVAAPAPTLAARPAAEPEFSARGQRALQYHKQAERSGLFVTDLAQRPWWVRLLVIASVIAVAGALAWGVYRGVLALREGSSHSTAVEER